LTVKTKKVGNAIVVAIPNELEIPEDVEFDPVIDADGNLVFKRLNGLTSEQKDEIIKFMDQCQPLMKKLKDKKEEITDMHYLV
jgi:antitoxin component of MazEF toxin-antitoxin module